MVHPPPGGGGGPPEAEESSKAQTKQKRKNNKSKRAQDGNDNKNNDERQGGGKKTKKKSTTTTAKKKTSDENSRNTKNKKKKEDKTGNGGTASSPPPADYNPRWVGYSFIAIGSLINFGSMSEAAGSTEFQFVGSRAVSSAFGILSFSAACSILFFDRTQLCIDRVNFKKVRGGWLEGCTLLALVAVWTVGVTYQTQVGGIAYISMNVYLSAWLAFGAALYTLNEWSASKDILTFAEMTSLSATLKSWYVVFASSVITVASAINMLRHVEPEHRDDASIAITLGSVSMLMSLSFILVHYKLLCCCACFCGNKCMKHGGWVELAFAAVLVLIWIVNTVVITQDEGIGSTVQGNGCGNWQLRALIRADTDGSLLRCGVMIQRQGLESTVVTCDLILVNDLPGSNLYLSTWAALASAFSVCFRWKAQQALQFAQARNKATTATAAAAGALNDNPARGAGGGGGMLGLLSNDELGDMDMDNDDDDDLEDFQDAISQ